MADVLSNANNPSKMLANLIPRTPLTRSWLFEVINTQYNKIIDSFTLVLPPQAYTIVEKQRVSITKTFGNAFIDDYGSDNLEITIKGISGTAKAFPTFQTHGIGGLTSANNFDATSFLRLQAQALKADLLSYEGYTHREAFFAFRDSIMRYKNRKLNPADVELRVYDLWDEEAYKCVLTEFSVDRTADHPFHYPFTIHLFVFEKLTSGIIGVPSILPFWKDPSILLDRIDICMSFISTICGEVQSILDSVAKIRALSAALRAKLASYRSQISGVFSKRGSIKDFCEKLWSAHVNLGLAIATAATLGYIPVTKHKIKKAFNESKKACSKISVGSYDTNYATAPSFAIDIKPTFNEDGSITTNSVSKDFNYSGYKTMTVTDQTSLQKIALQEYGDDSLWFFIADANKLSGNDALVPGDTIYIPLKSNTVNSSDSNFNANIIGKNPLKDPYGQDIKINSSGSMEISESGDFNTVTGIENVKQAINNRLKTEEGAMLKQTSFGLAATTGSSWNDVVEKYLRMSLKMTLLKDPRISSVNGVTFYFSDGVLYVSMNIELVGYDNIIPLDAKI